ncbi:MAG: LON peptidase substrate-binding domain-containing protein [Devosia sp.]
MAHRPESLADLPETLPIFPLTGVLLLPFGQRPLNIFEPRYIEMVDDALAGNRLIGLIQPVETEEESPQGRAALRDVGCIGRITHFEEQPDGRYFVILSGICRFRVTAEPRQSDRPYRVVRIDVADFPRDFDRTHGEEAVDRAKFLKMMHDYAAFAEIDLNWDEIKQTGTADLVNFCSMVSPYGPAEKQVLLEAANLNERAETLIAMAEYEMARGGTGAAPLQ